MMEPGVHDGPDGDMIEAAVMKAAQGVAAALTNFVQASVNTKIQEVSKWMDKKTESLVKTYLEKEKKKSSNVGDQKKPSISPVASHQGRTAMQRRQLPPEKAGTSSPAKRPRTSLTDSSHSAASTPQQQTAPHYSISMATSSEPTLNDYDLQLSLLRAVKSGRAKDVNSFIKMKVNPNITDKKGNTLLHIAVNNAIKKKDKDNSASNILGALLQYDSQLVDAKNNVGQTPLHVAASIPNGVSCVNHLLDFNANVYAADKKGETPLHCAARTGNEKTAKMLVLRGASLNVQNFDGKTPIDVAKDDNMRRSLLQDKLSPSAEETSFLEVDLNEDNFEGNEMSP